MSRSLRRLPGTGLPIQEADSRTALVVCGENPRDIFKAIEHRLKRAKKRRLAWGYREFYLVNYRTRGRSLNVFVGGLGSASVELLLQEGVLAGMRNFILAGTCASLKKNMPIGRMVLPNKVCFRPGALNEYVTPPAQMLVESNLQKQFESYLTKKALPFSKGSIISTDAFYGIGGSLEQSGRPIYAGAKMKDGKEPISLSIALENKPQCDLLDMECAPFFGLGSLLQDANVAALKVVCNHLPWQENDFELDRVKTLLCKNLNLVLDFIIDSRLNFIHEP